MSNGSRSQFNGVCNPFSEGAQNKAIIRTVANYFQIGGAGYGDAMYLKRDQYKEHPQNRLSNLR